MKTRRFLPFAVMALLLSAAAGLSACTNNVAGQKAVDAARTQIGQPYVSGGESRAEGGFDCSGLTTYAWTQAGATGIPRTSVGQYQWATPVTKTNLRAGDLVFYSSTGPTGTVSHVALYSGEGTIIQAHKPGVPLSEDKLEGYWDGHLVGYGRVPASAMS
ncbi:MAG: C40 family peptidase [Acidimicrobiales bacterium]